MPICCPSCGLKALFSGNLQYAWSTMFFHHFWGNFGLAKVTLRSCERLQIHTVYRRIRMVRHYKRKIGSRRYNSDASAAEAAANAVRDGLSQREAALKYGISRGTI